MDTVVLIEPCNPPYVIIASCKPIESCKPTCLEMLTATTNDFSGKDLTFDYYVTGNRVTGEGPPTKWNLAGHLPGSYGSLVTVTDTEKHKAASSLLVNVEFCKCVKK